MESVLSCAAFPCTSPAPAGLPAPADRTQALLQAMQVVTPLRAPAALRQAIAHQACLLSGARRSLLVDSAAHDLQATAPIQAEALRCRGKIHDRRRVRVNASADAARLAAATWVLPLVHEGRTLARLHLTMEDHGAALDADPALQACLQQFATHAAICLEHALDVARLQQDHAALAHTTRALRASQELLKQGERFNHTGSMRYLVRDDLMICSDELCRIYGLPPGQDRISYDQFAALLHPDDRQEVIETVNTAVAMGGTIRVEHRICRQDTGEVRYISGIGKPVWADGTFIEYVGTATDITRRRQAEYAMRAAQIDMERVARANTVGQLTASIAHEINQPLMSILANAGASLRWLERSLPELEQARASLHDIIAEGQRAAGIISSLQSLTRNSTPVCERVALHALIQHVLALSRSELQRRDITLVLALHAGELHVLGDPVQLQQVLLNLVVNAIEAMGQPGLHGQRLRISSRCSSADQIEVSVEDSGEGIAAQAMPRIFDAFYTTKSTGMGMGLAICRSIIEHHRGRLWVQAAQPRGTVCRFSLTRVP